MTDDDLATQGAGTSSTMIFTMLNWINSAPARKGLKLMILPLLFTRGDGDVDDV